jgi:hypothetical protein
LLNLACCMVALLFSPEDGGGMFCQNVTELLPDYMASQSRRPYCSWSLLRT